MPETILLLAFCGLVVVASLAAIGWALASGAFQNMDGLLAIVVSLMSLLIFGGNMLYSLRDHLARLRPARPNPSSPGSASEAKAASAASPARSPAPASPGQVAPGGGTAKPRPGSESAKTAAQASTRET